MRKLKLIYISHFISKRLTYRNISSSFVHGSEATFDYITKDNQDKNAIRNKRNIHFERCDDAIDLVFFAEFSVAGKIIPQDIP